MPDNIYTLPRHSEADIGQEEGSQDEQEDGESQCSHALLKFPSTLIFILF